MLNFASRIIIQFSQCLLNFTQLELVAHLNDLVHLSIGHLSQEGPTVQELKELNEGFPVRDVFQEDFPVRRRVVDISQERWNLLV